jgi:hypothetical protein
MFTSCAKHACFANGIVCITYTLVNVVLARTCPLFDGVKASVTVSVMQSKEFLLTLGKRLRQLEGCIVVDFMAEGYKLITAWGKFLDWKVTRGIVREFNDMVVIEYFASRTNPSSVLGMIILRTQLLGRKKSNRTIRDIEGFEFNVTELVVGIKHRPANSANALDVKATGNTFDLGMLKRVKLTDEV